MDPSRDDLTRFAAISEQAARAGGKRLMEWLGKINIREKAAGDLVTQADFDSQRVIRQLLQQQLPAHGFLAEEDDGLPNDLNRDGYCWIVDPLDGTINYIYQLPSFSVSVGLAYRGQLIVGCVYDPWLDECFCAAHGNGATLNGQSIRVNACHRIEDALMVCSLTSRIEPDHPQSRRFLQVLHRARSVRRLGSAALNLCYVGCGRLDGYWSASVSLWDVAAGIVILREAGGLIEHIQGGPFQLSDPQFLATASERLQRSTRPLMDVPASV